MPDHAPLHPCELREERCALTPLARVRERRYRLPVLGIVVAGAFDYRADNGSATAVPGTLLLGNAEEQFRCEHRHGCGNLRKVVHFSTAVIRDIAGSVGLDEPRFRAAAAPPGVLASRAFGCIQRLAAAGGSDPELAYELAGLALQINRSPFEPARVPERVRVRLFEVVRHLEQHYEERLTLRHLAQIAQLSTYHFLRSFKRVVGQSPTQYLMHVRLRAAGALLLGGARVGETALQTGFNDISHFNACFRRVYGCAPTRWRTV
jgi:AraC-like DNA-binding protein